MKTVKELAAELGVSKSTLHRLIQKLNQDCVIETVQRDNKILIDDATEKAIIQAFNEKASHGDASCTDAETMQKRVKCTDYETLYIESLKQQIETLTNQIAVKDNQIQILTEQAEKDRLERQTILAQLLDLKQQTKVITVNAAEQPTVKPQTVKRSTPKPTPKHQTFIDKVKSIFKI